MPDPTPGSVKRAGYRWCPSCDNGEGGTGGYVLRSLCTERAAGDGFFDDEPTAAAIVCPKGHETQEAKPAGGAA